ncbi:MAG TPA: hydrogenase maturation protease [Candidatus Sulfotelmatobacter sp.]|nr:hydrogenase maturation protease [Candidatus Sulfotelmatobacter sp.]
MSKAAHNNRDHSATSETRETRVRVLCLGNELLADDSLGLRVAENVRRFAPQDVEVISTSESGFHLLDYVSDVQRLIVVDTLATGTSSPGTIYAFHDHELKAVPGDSPHYVGLCETLSLARLLGMPVAEEVIFLAVEAADCSTLGGEMHPDVGAAIPQITSMVRDMLRQTLVQRMKRRSP